MHRISLRRPSATGAEPSAFPQTAAVIRAQSGLWQHPPYFHDGSAPDLLAVVNHYNTRFGLNLTAAQKRDLVEFLKSL